jgi:hypothetical protein
MILDEEIVEEIDAATAVESGAAITAGTSVATDVAIGVAISVAIGVPICAVLGALTENLRRKLSIVLAGARKVRRRRHGTITLLYPSRRAVASAAAMRTKLERIE